MWSFPKAGPEHSNSSSKLNEFFNDHDASTSLVREAAQNSLDAALSPDTPVRVRFSLATFPWSVVEPFLKTGQATETVNNHLKSGDLGKFSCDFKNQNLRCLIIEDEGTKGLIGETDKSNAHSGSNFVGFWWNDGISVKGKGSSGSHGVGKTTLSRISGMSLFLAVTKRSDDNQRFLLGFANLPYHRVNKADYLGYGRYGETFKDNHGEKFMPIDKPKQIDKFLSTFSMSREHPGLSVFIPGVPKAVDKHGLLIAVIRDYYWPILKGDLIVEVNDRDIKKSTTVSAKNIINLISNLTSEAEQDQRVISDTKHQVYIAEEILKLRTGGNPNWFAGNDPIMTLTSNGSIRGKVAKECFSEDNLLRMLAAYENGQLVGFSFSLKLETINGQKQVGIVEVYLKKTDHTLTENTQFLRNQIIISKQPSFIPKKNVMCFLVAEDRDMSDYLKDAEEPAHTRWFINRFNEQKNYTSDWALRFVSELPSQMYKILSREDEDASSYENFADDIFSIPQPDGNGAKRKKNKRPERTNTPTELPDARRQPAVRIQRDLENPGFELLPVANINELFEEEGLSFPIEISIRAAYVSALGKGRSWKDYSKIDFEFQKSIPIQISPEGSAKIVNASKNSFTVSILQPDFRVSAKGFDRNRDLLVHPKIKL